MAYKAFTIVTQHFRIGTSTPHSISHASATGNSPSFPKHALPTPFTNTYSRHPVGLPHALSPSHTLIPTWFIRCVNLTIIMSFIQPTKGFPLHLSISKLPSGTYRYPLSLWMQLTVSFPHTSSSCLYCAAPSAWSLLSQPSLCCPNPTDFLKNADIPLVMYNLHIVNCKNVKQTR